jgi:AraC family transcriptional regulator
MASSISPRARGGLASWQARRVREIALDHLAEVRVAGLAAAVRLSPHHFSRAFHATFGVPAREWLLQQKLEVAQRRLRTTSDQVEQIARDIGYSSSSPFARAFRERFGVAPLTYRRRDD